MAANRKAFTLIELLVVISIIALLLSILMPALGRAREAAKRIVCGSNLKQMSVTWYMYTMDYKGKIGYCSSLLPTNQQSRFPRVNSWTWGGLKGWADIMGPLPEKRLLFPYIKDIKMKLFSCPSDKGNAAGWGGKKNFEACGNSYGMSDSINRGILGYNITKITRPGNTILAFDATVLNKWATDFYKPTQPYSYWHPNGGSNMGMVDGSYKTIDRKTIEACQPPKNMEGISWGFLNPAVYGKDNQWD